jgi:hypothetical protein
VLRTDIDDFNLGSLLAYDGREQSQPPIANTASPAQVIFDKNRNFVVFL